MNRSTKVLASVALALGIGTLIVNPRGNFTDDSLVLLSCTTRQILVIDRGKPSSDELVIPTGIYTTKGLTDTLYQQMETTMEETLAGNPFAGMMDGFIKSLRPGIEDAMNAAIDSRCAFKEASFAPKDLTSK